MTQFRNFDAPRAEQVVSIRWEQIELDDDSGESPEDRDEGFWPSRDPDAAGYVGEVEDDAFAQMQDAAQERMDAFNDGEWGYVGVIARAHISIPIGQGSFTTYTLDSPGLWGIENEADSADYRAQVFEEQKAELLGHLRILGAYIIAQPE